MPFEPERFTPVFYNELWQFMMQSPGNKADHDAGRPLVSIIVPARNEGACLGECLASLVQQTAIAREILVVDDDSTDATRAIAEGFPGVRVLASRHLAPGQSGKCNAAQTGADEALGEWLLFTDADTVHEPGSLARAVAEAEQYGADLLSYSPRQEVEGFWEKAVMPVVFAELASRYRPSEVCDPASPTAAANGQYLLIRRETYDAVGGHAAVAHTLLEDVELARAVKRSGRNLRFRYGGDAVSARMYRNFAELRDGWTKNLALLFPDALQLARKRAAEVLLLSAGAATGAAGIASGRVAWTVTGWGLATLISVRVLARLGRANFGWPEVAFSPAGLPVFAYLLLRSHRGHRGHCRVQWKGRVYPGEQIDPRAHKAGISLHAHLHEKAKHDGVLDPQV
jgi:hypothetical protein